MVEPVQNFSEPWVSVGIYGLSLVLGVILSTVVYANQDTRNPIIRRFLAMSMLLNAWMIISMIHQSPISMDAKYFIYRISSPIWIFLGWMILRFYEAIIGIHSKGVSSRIIILPILGSLLGIATPWIEQRVTTSLLGYYAVPGVLSIPVVITVIGFPIITGLYLLWQHAKQTEAEESKMIQAIVWGTPTIMLGALISSVLLPTLEIVQFSEYSQCFFVLLFYVYYHLVIAKKGAPTGLTQAAHLLFQELHDGIILLDLEGRIEHANPAADRLLGTQLEKYVGLSLQGPLPNFMNSFWYQDYPFRLERQGKVVTFNITVVLQKNRGIAYGKLVILRDTSALTQLKKPDQETETTPFNSEISSERILALQKAQERIRERETLLQSLIDNLPFQIYIKDLRGVYILQNKTDQERRGNLLGQSLESSPSEAARVQEALQADQKVLSGESYETEFEENIRGQVFRFRVIKKPLFTEYRTIQGILGIYIDITENYRLEKERMQFKERLMRSHKMEAIGTLAGGIAHDFNNILGSLSGYAEIATEVIPQESPAQNYLKEVLIAAERGRQLVQQILTFSRNQEKDKRPVSLQFTVQETLKLLKSSTPKDIRITTNLPDEELFILGDPIELHRIIMNLSTNAIHSMKSGGGEIRIAVSREQLDQPKQINGQVLPAGIWNRLTVTDTGSGIPQNVITRIFDPFFTTKQTSEGTGLGLSVVLGIIQNWGGVIHVDSRLGEGSRFDIYLPNEQPRDRRNDQLTTSLKLEPQIPVLIHMNAESRLNEIRQGFQNLPIQWIQLHHLEDIPRLWRVNPWKIAILEQQTNDLPIAMLVHQWQSQGIHPPLICLGGSETSGTNEELHLMQKVTMLDRNCSTEEIRAAVEKYLWQKS